MPTLSEAFLPLRIVFLPYEQQKVPSATAVSGPTAKGTIATYRNPSSTTAGKPRGIINDYCSLHTNKKCRKISRNVRIQVPLSISVRFSLTPALCSPRPPPPPRCFPPPPRPSSSPNSVFTTTNCRLRCLQRLQTPPRSRNTKSPRVRPTICMRTFSNPRH